MVRRPLHPIVPLSHRFYSLLRLAGTRPLSSSSNIPDKVTPPTFASSASEDPVAEAEAEARKDAYRQLQNLDFMTAAKILFTTPPKRKKFGLDFHLVQLFFACMPSLAVYMVAQYARYEIRRMEAEVEEKKKLAEEEEKAKEAELCASDEGPAAELSKVKVRLDALEVAVKEIVDEKKKITSSSLSKDQEINKEKQATSTDKESDPQAQSKASASSKRETISDSGTSANIAAQKITKEEQRVENSEKASGTSKK